MSPPLRTPWRPCRWLAPLCLSAACVTPVRGPERLGADRCAASDSAAQAKIRDRLAAWVVATNQGDLARSREIWAPGLVGWFPEAPLFGDSAAFAAVGAPYRSGLGLGRVTYELVVEDVAVSGPIAAVHDVWTETHEVPGGASRVTRQIRGSELWRCQPDGQWRIARFVSAPEPWSPVR